MTDHTCVVLYTQLHYTHVHLGREGGREGGKEGREGGRGAKENEEEMSQ